MLRRSQHTLWPQLISVTLSLAAITGILSGTIGWQDTAHEASATTSGGRSRGGSFGEDQPPAEDSSDSSKPSPNRSSDERTRNNGSSDRYDSTRSNTDRSSTDRSSTDRSNNTGTIPGEFLFLVIIVVMVATPAGRNFLNRLVQYVLGQTKASEQLDQANAAMRSSAAQPRTKRRISGEITNNIVTITQLQVAMHASARHVQQALNRIAEETDLGTPEGLTLSLRETVVTLLRSPETWTHAIATSKTVSTKQEAKQRFEALSIEERSKFDVESMVNTSGQLKHREMIERPEDIASHIVVTLIVGTAHDSPIIDPVMSSEELRLALKRLGSITPDYLMVYEVLWSPQDESDSLTEEELLLNYPKMFQL